MLSRSSRSAFLHAISPHQRYKGSRDPRDFGKALERRHLAVRVTEEVSASTDCSRSMDEIEDFRGAVGLEESAQVVKVRRTSNDGLQHACNRTTGCGGEREGPNCQLSVQLHRQEKRGRSNRKEQSICPCKMKLWAAVNFISSFPWR